MLLRTLLFSAWAVLATAGVARANDVQPKVFSEPDSRRFPLAAGGAPASLHVSEADYPGVFRAVRDLQADLERVTGNMPALVLSQDAHPAASAVLIGTLDKSPIIDQLVQEGRLDTTGVSGRWETFVTQVVSHPLPGLDEALVIAGSDKRGTIYGVYDLSQQIGVSPWYWWADVPVRRRNELHVDPERRVVGEPAVRYRGIFINDENPALLGWVNETFGGFNHQFYSRVYELILRMKGNYLWPAMWGKALYDDDPLNASLADEYGIVIGTSHHEPMMRAHVEWSRYGSGPWNYVANEDTLKSFWREGIRRMGANESIVTLGMRGDGDEPMTQGTAIALLERIVADQRRIIEEETGRAAEQTPQVWALYKEVQDYFDEGMTVPDDVTLLFADDNWGNIRRLPIPDDAPRPGGYGVYYHYDYVGGPRNYKWINTNQIERVWEQMHLAYRHGADRLWIVNVGDIKPMEFPIEFFLDYAWDPDAWPLERLSDYTRIWAERQFGGSHAAEIAEVLSAYTRNNSRRKPELLSTETYSLVDYREAERVVDEYRDIAKKAERIKADLLPEYHDAFYQLVLYPALASANLNELYVTVGKNRLYAQQGRVSANRLAERARTLFDRDAELTRVYHEDVAGGKWNHMMSQTHIGYTYWQEPPENSMPAVAEIEAEEQGRMGVAVEGSSLAWPGAEAEALLPQFDPFQQQEHYIDIFNRGGSPFSYEVETGVSWLHVSPISGEIAEEERISVRVNWSQAPPGLQHAEITITASDGQRVVVRAPVFNPAEDSPAASANFIESNGIVSMEAEHFSRAVGRAPTEWVQIPGLGRTLSGMTAFPVTVQKQSLATTEPAQAPSTAPFGDDDPRLEYRTHMFRSGEVTANWYLSPSLAFNGSEGLRFAVSVDNEPPQIVNMHADGAHIPENGNRAWENMVADNVKIVQTRHVIDGPGEHVFMFWLVDPGVVLQKVVVDAGGLRPSYLGPPETALPRGQAQRSSAGARDNPLATRQNVTSSSSYARFDWFEYEGRDPVFEQMKAGDGEYLNPILTGFYPDPSIVRVEEDYYLVTSSFAYFPGVPIFHSRDLVNWTQIGHVLDRPSQLDLDGLGISRGIFAPAIEYHDGTFYMVTTLVDNGGNFVVTSTDPAGPWSDPVWLPELDGIDPSIFFDDDGRAYIMNNGPPPSEPLYDGHRAIWIQEFDASTLQTTGPRKVIVDGGVDITKKPIWIEAPHIFKTNDTYYLIAAEGGTGTWHSEVVFRSQSVWGPWVPYEGNPILTQRHLDPSRPFPVTSAGHADFVETQTGDWWAVFLATRPYADDLYNTGRETFLMPVRWVDGWPIVTVGDEVIPYVGDKPALPPDPPPGIPMQGNFTVRDEFEGPSLSPYWTFIRTPREAWHDLTTAPGMLTIRARAVELHSSAQPSFIGRRQQHAWASASAKLHFEPTGPADRAGLAAFQSESYYYFLSLTADGGTRVVKLERRSGPGPDGLETIASAQLPSASSDAIYLKIDARGDTYSFYYALRPDEWRPLLEDADGTILSTRVAGGFVGAMLGMYAASNAEP